VLHEEKSGDDAQHSEQARAPVSEVHASPLGVDGALASRAASVT
jgi:hypothetical protein